MSVHGSRPLRVPAGQIYVNEGMRAAFTSAPHMHLYIIYPVVVAFRTVFLSLGLRNFRRRVLS